MGVDTAGSDTRSTILTFLIADVRGYTSYTQAHGDRAAARLASTFAEIAREGVEAHGGEVIELRGDEALAVFDNAPEALRAAVDLQTVFADEIALHPDVPLRVGIGVDAGAAVPVERGYRGAALNLAARLCSKAVAGEVLASEGVLRLAGSVDGVAVHPHGEFEMKGIEDPVRVSRVAPDDLHPDALAARFEIDGRSPPVPSEVPSALDTVTPIVGRERELHRLRWAWRLARRHEGSLIFVFGPQGIGKTRLVAELAAGVALDGARISYASLRDSAASASSLEGPVDPDLLDLLILDDLEEDPDALEVIAEHLGRLDGTRALLVVAGDDSALDEDRRRLAGGTGGAVVRPTPLDLDDVRRIAGLYLGESADVLPASLLEATGGVPRRVHRQVSEWAYSEASRRLGAAASRAAAGRSGLRSVESELAGNVVDLQLIQERTRLYEAHDRVGGAETTASPFKGLASFEPSDADLFFGRERLVADLVARLAGASLLGVVGPSGSGKSSAVRAGLIPALVSGVLPGSDDWAIALLRPGEHPLESLDGALRDALPEVTRTRLPAAKAMIGDLGEVLSPDGHVLVVIDQFEEVFTTCRDEEERARFLSAVSAAGSDPDGRATVIVTIRADFYGRCAEDAALAELLGANHVLVGPMTADEYRRAIEQPALRVGVHVEPALTEALLGEVLDEPGALPLLSTALLELWDRRDGREIRLDAYVETGGVRGAVSRLAEQVYSGFTAEQQAVARAVMLRLAGPGEGDAVVRRRVPLAEFDAERNEDVAHVVAVLTDRRLLTVSEGVVEVAHEALLREWHRLGGWIEEDRTGRWLHAHLMETARGWAGADRDPSELYRGARLASALDWTAGHALELNEVEREFLSASRQASEHETDRQRRTNRRLRALLAGVAAFLALALVAGGLALVQRDRAERSAEAAEARRLGAQAVIEDELDTSLLLAREALAIDDSVDTRSTLLATLLKAPGAIAMLPGTGDRVLEVHASADHSVLATSDNIGGVAIYDTDALELRRIVHLPDEGGSPIAMSPDGREIAYIERLGEFGTASLGFISTVDGSARSVSLPEGTDFLGTHPFTYLPGSSELVSFEFRAGSERPFVVRRDAGTGQELAARPLDVANPDWIQASERSLIVASAQPALLTILDPGTLRTRATIEDAGLSFDISPDDETIAIGGFDGTVALLDASSGKRTVLDGRHTAAVTGVGFTPDGSTLVTTGDDRDVIVWDLREGALSEILHGHAGRAFGPTFDRDGETAFTVGLDGRVIAWDLTSERRLGQRAEFADPSVLEAGFLESAGDLVTAASLDGSRFAFSPANGQLHMYSVDEEASAWEVDPWTEAQFERILAGDEAFAAFDSDVVNSLAFDPDSGLLAVGGRHGEVVTYDAASGREVARWTGSEIAWVNSFVFDADGSLITANDDGRVAWWDPMTGALQRELRVTPRYEDPDSFVGAVARAVPSPDGSALAVVTYEQGGAQELMVLDAETGETRWDGVEPDRWDVVLAWSPDGGTIATGGSQRGDLNLWHARTGRRLAEPVRASAGFVLSVDFALGGSLIVTGATDGTVRLFDATTLKQLGANIPATDNLWAFAHVLPNEEVLVVSQSGHLWRWSFDPQDWADHACSVANRALTRSEWGAFLPGRDYEPHCGR
jgi:WD40 repeat protein/class 3 adenylate cyclase